MRAFAELLDRLVLTPQRNGKLRLLVDYFRATPDPDRGLALAAITRDLELQSVKTSHVEGADNRAHRSHTLCLFL